LREFMRKEAPRLASAIDKNEPLPSGIGINMAKKKEFRALLRAASSASEPDSGDSPRAKTSMPGQGVTLGGSTPQRS